jgi:DNA-directed RNA polymerase subunit RPC12/RpoP
MYTIILCYNCGNFLIAKSTQKTRRCPSCNSKIELVKAKKLVHLKTAREASNYIRLLKKKKAELS